VRTPIQVLPRNPSIVVGFAVDPLKHSSISGRLCVAPALTSMAGCGDGWMRRGLAGVLSVTLGLVGVLLVGCARGSSTLTVPLARWPGYAYFDLAEQRGLARAQGLSLATRNLDDPQQMVPAFSRGELELAQVTTLEALQICQEAPARCPVVLLVLNESRGADQLLARPGSTDLAALRGQRIGVTSSSLGPFLVHQALATAGLTLADVELVPAELPKLDGMLRRGEVAAIASFPPYSTYLTRLGLATVLFDSGRLPGQIVDVLVAERGYALRHRRELGQLLRTWQAAHNAARADPQAARTLMAKRLKLSAQQFADAEQGIAYLPLSEQQTLLQPGGPLDQNLEMVQAVYGQLGLLSPGSPRPRVDDGPLREALTR
jgi:NitT/TauT family transport system substrate-binding protein